VTFVGTPSGRPYLLRAPKFPWQSYQFHFSGYTRATIFLPLSSEIHLLHITSIAISPDTADQETLSPYARMQSNQISCCWFTFSMVVSSKIHQDRLQLVEMRSILFKIRPRGIGGAKFCVRMHDSNFEHSMPGQTGHSNTRGRQSLSRPSLRIDESPKSRLLHL
jgi:hypothetical protein